MARKRRAETPPPEIPDLPSLLSRLNITRWDALIVGDGSGTGWQDGCGWAHTVIDRLTRGRRMFRGACDGGSVNLAELMPVLHGLTWFHQTVGRDRLRHSGGQVIHIVTDSTTTVEHGRQALDLSRPILETNLLFWSGVREFHRLGYEIHFHWLGRSTTDLNRAADLVAALARRGNLDLELRVGLTPVEAEHVRDAARVVCNTAQAAASEVSLRHAVDWAAYALRTLLRVHGTDADRAALGIETARMEDPNGHSPIDVNYLTPDG